MARQIMEATDDGAELIAYALKVWRDPEADPRDRQWAHGWLSDRGMGKPLAQHEVTAAVVSQSLSAAPVTDWALVPLEERRAALATFRRARGELAPAPLDVTEGSSDE